ncbi:hypothetical protein ACJIZ3_011282 [Penstemon smallii]|uniref:Uncharacterized protein n=1 Tax=Penstemon smallii TaxID=265156 RepID=A0ABD3UM81_9LAMI
MTSFNAHSTFSFNLNFLAISKLHLHLWWFNPFRGVLGTLSGYLSQQGFEPESATL